MQGPAHRLRDQASFIGLVDRALTGCNGSAWELVIARLLGEGHGMRAVSAKAAPTSQEGLAGVLRCSAAAPLTRPVEGCRPPLTTRRTTVHRVAGRACTATCLRRLVNPILFRPLPPIARPPLEPRRRPSVCATRAQPVVSRDGSGRALR